MSERILVPLDGSTLGEAAISYVKDFIAKMAPEQKVSVTLFHVITEVTHDLDMQRYGEAISIPYTDEELAKMKEKATEYLQSVGEALAHDKVTVTCKVSVNPNPADEIINVEKEVDADLVAMSTHGRSGITRFALGSIADKVLQGGSVPVLMVRASDKG